ncbi:MAG: leucine-rich repeat domain-containing protein, partial [Clostridia bacterium]|nr:leucine-rich repeat domain-containing protein [Clostridia bacterium]
YIKANNNDYYLAYQLINKNLSTYTIQNTTKILVKKLFSDCSRLNSITIPNSVKSIDWVFSECTSLTSVVIEEGVTSIGDFAFRDCTSLKSIVIPNSVTSIGDFAFKACYSLENIEIPNSVTSLGKNAFSECYSLENIEIPNSVTSIGSMAFAYCGSLESIEIPNSVTSIGSMAFYACYSLTNIEIPNSVTSIGGATFGECTSLTNVVIPNSVTSIEERAFYGCKKLEKITLPFIGATLNGTSNTHFGYIFDAPRYSSNNSYVPTSLKEVIITGASSISNNAFYNCSSLTSIEIPDSVTSIGSSAFYGCSLLEKVNYTGTIGEWAQIKFNDVSANPTYYAKKLYINDVLVKEAKITTATKISDYAFYNCTSLTSIEIPNIISIGALAFYGCPIEKATMPMKVILSADIPKDKIKTLKISGGDTIFSYAFENYTSLESIVIPNSVKGIVAYAFDGCTSLTYIFFEGYSTWYRTTLDSNFEDKKGGTPTDLTNSNTNAYYFTEKYTNCYWYKR